MVDAYSLSEERRMEFAGLVLLQDMVEHQGKHAVLPELDAACLEPVFDWLYYKKAYIKIQSPSYVPTPQGREVVERFSARYTEFLKVFDVYSAVDLDEGEFAFERYFDFEEEADWLHFLDQDRFADLRIAIAKLKGIDPVEVVFMSFISEGRIVGSDQGWQQRLASGELWEEILEIVDTSIRVEDMGYQDEEGDVPGLKVLEEVIREGAELNMELKKREGEVQAADSSEADSEEHGLVEEEIVTYYEPYLDPYYISPVWGGLWII